MYADLAECTATQVVEQKETAVVYRATSKVGHIVNVGPRHGLGLKRVGRRASVKTAAINALYPAKGRGEGGERAKRAFRGV